MEIHMNWNDHFRYEDGNLFWIFPMKGRVLSKPAGHKRKDGYSRITFLRKKYSFHRVVWEMHNGKIQDGIEIDHIDRNPSNNRIENLRLATSQENKRNNKSNGFTWCKRDKAYVAKITIDGKRKFIGHYNNMIDARAAYLKARREHFGDFA
jgi:hypothetical protein